MNTNKKVYIIVSTMLSILAFAIIFNVSINISAYGKYHARDKANSVAESVRDGLTAHMVSGTMDKRDLFLENMIRHQKVENLRVLRSKTVVEQFGLGKIDNYEYDDIEKKVLESGKTEIKISANKDNIDVMRITIPYIATKYSNPNCVSCHTNAKEGDVLGVISMNISLLESYDMNKEIIIKILIISLVFLILAIFITSRYIKPYIKLFDDLEEGISRAYQGDFSFHVKTTLSDEAGQVAKRLNDLSEIFRFKKTIELDTKKEDIYSRIGYILENIFKLKNFYLYEVNNKTKKREIVFKPNYLEYYNEGIEDSDITKCRALVTGSEVLSTEFYKICETCYSKECEYICLPFNISDEYSILIHIREKDESRIAEVKKLIPIISNYIELAEPVLETKLLLEELKASTLKDGLTGLYNRRFLDEYFDKILAEHKQKVAMLMIDIDYFKNINDTYGHDIGDKVLRELPIVLNENMNVNDMAIRFGGEEFLVLILEPEDDKAIFTVAENIRVSFSKIDFDAHGVKFHKTLSIGYAVYPTNGNNPWGVLKQADQALYEAKVSGRDKVVKYQEED